MVVFTRMFVWITIVSHIGVIDHLTKNPISITFEQVT